MVDGAPVGGARHARLDVLRGLAMVWMTAYHLCYDLGYFGWWRQDFLHDPFWTWQRTAIVSLFLLCVGLGQALAWQQAVPWRRFARRWAQVAGCALLVSAGSYAMFPRSFIYFGVLHGVAVMLLVARASAGWRLRWLWLAGAVALALPWLAEAVLAGPLAASAPAWDSRALNWLGWITRKPFTEDYVPVFPWLGVVWWGMALGRWLLQRPSQPLAGRVAGASAPLAWLGRHSLAYYMLHQPVLIGALGLWGWLAR